MRNQGKYTAKCPEQEYLDIRILEIGGYRNVINFFIEADGYIFYDNVFVTAFMDKDVETDTIPYPQYGNQDIIRKYNENAKYLKFLPYTPEVLLVKTYLNKRREFLNKLRSIYNNQQVEYSISEQLDFSEYETALPNFTNQNAYNDCIKKRGDFRNKCKEIVGNIADELSESLNVSKDEIYRFSFKFAIDNIPESELSVQALLAQTMKRIR